MAISQRLPGDLPPSSRGTCRANFQQSVQVVQRLRPCGRAHLPRPHGCSLFIEEMPQAGGETIQTVCVASARGRCLIHGRLTGAGQRGWKCCEASGSWVSRGVLSTVLQYQHVFLDVHVVF